MLTFPNIDPVAFHIPLIDVPVAWYGLSYVAAILLGWRILIYLNRRSGSMFTHDQLDDFVMCATIGIVLGGRVGYVLFYNLPFYLEQPLAIVQLWRGGMSFHGGLLGMIVAMIVFARKQAGGFWRLADYVGAAAPFGIFFGRLANFINGELYGRVTTSEWGMIFPNGGPLPRHPSQLYQALAEGLLLGIILMILIHTTRLMKTPGIVAASFVFGYGVLRFFVEFFRAPDAHIGFLNFGLTMGQILCIPMIIVAMITMVYLQRRSAS